MRDCSELCYFSRLKSDILGTRSPKCLLQKGFTNQFLFVYTNVKSLYIRQCERFTFVVVTDIHVGCCEVTIHVGRCKVSVGLKRECSSQAVTFTSHNTVAYIVGSRGASQLGGTF